MFKPTKDMTAKEYPEMEWTKMNRHDEIEELVKKFQDDEVYIHEFPEKVIKIMNGPVFSFPNDD